MVVGIAIVPPETVKRGFVAARLIYHLGRAFGERRHGEKMGDHMPILIAIMLLKLVTLTGSIALTAGFVGLFAFKDTLGPHLAVLWLGGLIAVAAGEGGAWLIGRHPAKTIETEP